MNLPLPSISDNNGLVALDVPDGLVRRLRPHSDPEVFSNGLHISLAYLKTLTIPRLKRTVQVLSKLRKNLQPFDLSVQGAGVFYAKKDIKIMLVNGSELSNWAYQVREALDREGLLPKQEYGFLPHITLSYHKKDLQPFWEEQVAIQHEWRCNAFSLYRGSKMRFRFSAA